MDISALPLGSIEAVEGGIRIGALARMSDVAAHPLVREQQGGGQAGGGGQPSGNFAEPHYTPFSDAPVHYLGQQIAVVVADTLEHATRLDRDRQPGSRDGRGASPSVTVRIAAGNAFTRPLDGAEL